MIPPPPYTGRPDAERWRGREAESTGSATIRPPGPTRQGRWMVRPLGVNQRPVVSLSAHPPSRVKMSCTTPLPKVAVPSTTARSWSWRAPATISDAEALEPSVSTTSASPASSRCGVAVYSSAGASRNSARSSGVPAGRKSDEMRSA